MVEEQNVESGSAAAERSAVSDKYDVLFRGNLQAGELSEQVKPRVAELFKLGPEKLEQLFAARLSYLKRNIDLATANKIVAAMASVGAEAEIQPAAHNKPSLSMAPLGADVMPLKTGEQTAGAAAVDHSKLAGLVAELPGTDVLGVAEKAEVKAVDIDVSHLSLEDL
jgi:hypothetical protein